MEIQLAEKLTLPADAVTQVFSFMGRRGSGKTYGAGRLVEQLLEAERQVVVLDPVGVWYGLRLAADGKGPGIKIAVFGGQHGDLPLEPTAGKLMAELVAVRGLSVVLDVSDMTAGEQRRFVAEFCGELLHAKKRNRSAVMVVFEEAQEFVPQHVSGEVAKMVGAVERLIKLGRNFGVGATLISQRPQAVNKDVLNQTEAMLAFQLTGPQERKAIAGWVQEKGAGERSIADELPGLPRGTAMVWSPQWLGIFGRYHILKKRTFDASATPRGGKVETAALAPINLDEVRALMAATVEEVTANDPTALRAEISRLNQQVRRLNADLEGAKQQPQEVQRVPAALHALLVETRQRLEVANNAAKQFAHSMDIEVVRMGEVLKYSDQMSRGVVVAMGPRPSSPAMSANIVAPIAGTGLQRLVQRTPPDPDGETKLDAGARRILGTLVARGEPLNSTQLGVLCRIHHKGSTMRTYVGKLLAARLAERTHDHRIIATPAGIAYAGAPPSLPAPRDLIAEWKGHKDIEGKAKDMLERVAADREVPLERLADQLNLEKGGSTMRTYVGRLLAFGLVSRGRGTLRIHPELAL